VALGVVALSCQPRRPRPEHAVVGPKLTLRGFESVRDTDVLRASLADDSGGFSSGGYRTRNVLFLEATGKAWWLLPDDDHVIEEHFVRRPGGHRYGEDSPPVAVVTLARPVGDESKLGDLYLLDPPGRRIQRIAEQVREVHGVAMTSAGMAILYERSGGYVLEHYDVSALRKLSAVPVDVPKLQ
jgi:hypothetical protein